MVSSGPTTAPPPPPASRAHPFDAVAPGYDRAFTETPLGRWYRSLVWERLERAFRPGDHVLELGCGTGEDAIWLAGRGVRVTATDASSEMLTIARRKAVDRGVDGDVRFSRLDLNAVDEEADQLPSTMNDAYDGAYSCFGPLNCVEDRRALAGALARAIRPGGRLVLVVMGPLCPWEVLWHAAHLEPGAAIRRLRSGAPARVGDGGTLPVWYPSIGRLEAEFAPHFDVLDRIGLGLLTPPTAMDGLVQRAPRLFNRLAVLDRRAVRLKPWLWLNDHYLLHLERRAP